MIRGCELIQTSAGSFDQSRAGVKRLERKSERSRYEGNQIFPKWEKYGKSHAAVETPPHIPKEGICVPPAKDLLLFV